MAVAHEMARIMCFMLVRSETYEDEDGGLVESKLKKIRERSHGWQMVK